MAVFQIGNQKLPSVMCNLCHFELTSSYLNHSNLLLHLTQRYLQQFQDLYTEERHKSVKICTYIQTKVAIPMPAGSNTVTVLQNNNLCFAHNVAWKYHGNSSACCSESIECSHLRTDAGHVSTAGTVVSSVSSGTGVPLSAATKISTAGWSD